MGDRMSTEPVVPIERIQAAIFVIRGQRVMLSSHLAQLYEVEPRVLVQAVKRNIDRFPDDFMFQLTWKEVADLDSCAPTAGDSRETCSRSQSVILKRGKNVKYPPYAFTEQGVAMLSSVLRSKRAIEVNIAIMRAFVRLREMLSSHRELAKKLGQLEQKVEKHDRGIQILFEAMKKLTTKHPPAIGFRVKEKRARYGRGRVWLRQDATDARKRKK